MLASMVKSAECGFEEDGYNSDGELSTFKFMVEVQRPWDFEEVDHSGRTEGLAESFGKNGDGHAKEKMRACQKRKMSWVSMYP
jgi:hypothetical protein